MAPRRTSTKGFKRTDSLLSAKIRQASETRGFAQSRLLTQWAEIVGQDVAAISRPVEVSYGRGGMGATLTLLTSVGYFLTNPSSNVTVSSQVGNPFFKAPWSSSGSQS